MKKQWIIATPDQLQQIANTILTQQEKKQNQPLIIALQGDLGAGKTTFVQELGKLLAVQEVITSPTFTIMKQYQTTHRQWQSLVHIDAYRLESEEEIRPLKIDEVISQPDTISCIEWPERIPHTIPSTAYRLQIKIIDGEKRKIAISS